MTDKNLVYLRTSYTTATAAAKKLYADNCLHDMHLFQVLNLPLFSQGSSVSCSKQSLGVHKAFWNLWQNSEHLIICLWLFYGE